MKKFFLTILACVFLFPLSTWAVEDALGKRFIKGTFARPPKIIDRSWMKEPLPYY